MRVFSKLAVKQARGNKKRRRCRYCGAYPGLWTRLCGRLSRRAAQDKAQTWATCGRGQGKRGRVGTSSGMKEIVDEMDEQDLLEHIHTRWRGQWRPTPVLLPGKSHAWRSLVGCSPWGRQESDTTKRLHFHFSLSCIGEGDVNPLQCSCLENPRDGEAWWAAIYGVAQSDMTEAT